MQLTRPIQTRFRFGSLTESINLATHRNSPARSTKSTTSRLNALCLLVSIRFQVLFHSPPGVLFTFPSRYYTLSVTRSYLALGDGPPTFTPDSSCPVLLWILTAQLAFRLQGYHFVSPDFPIGSTTLIGTYMSPNPEQYCYHSVWAFSRSIAST